MKKNFNNKELSMDDYRQICFLSGRIGSCFTSLLSSLPGEVQSLFCVESYYENERQLCDLLNNSDEYLRARQFHFYNMIGYFLTSLLIVDHHLKTKMKCELDDCWRRDSERLHQLINLELNQE